jgi:hypothetical protein
MDIPNFYRGAFLKLFMPYHIKFRECPLPFVPGSYMFLFVG